MPAAQAAETTAETTAESVAPSGKDAPAGTTPSDLELVITRVFDAPRGLVFDAWTRPEHLAHWQGAPRDVTVTTNEADVRPGGAYRICMRSPQGVDHWLQGVYREVVAPERLVFTHVWLNADGMPGKETLVTINFAELRGKTKLTLRQTGFTSADSRDGHETGWSSAMDVLSEYLARIPHD